MLVLPVSAPFDAGINQIVITTAVSYKSTIDIHNKSRLTEQWAYFAQNTNQEKI
jgi:hypothetical protein